MAALNIERLLRRAFFAARTLSTSTISPHSLGGGATKSPSPPLPEQRNRTVAAVLADEQPRLLSLPAHPFQTDVMRTATSGRTPYVPLRPQSLLD